MFEPGPIANQAFFLSGQTQARMATAELALARVDERLRTSPLKLGILQELARLEAISTLRIDGYEPNYRELLKLEFLYTLYQQNNPGTSLKDFAEQNPWADKAALETLKYETALRWIVDGSNVENDFTRETLLDLHSLCLHGATAVATGTSFRTRPYEAWPEKASSLVYRPPAPAELSVLVDDLCLFASKNLFSPTAQAALAHFQFEGLKPFKRGLDRTGRAMCHAIMYRRGAFRNCIAPIALMPAIYTPKHAELLLPYDMGYDIEGQERTRRIDEWVWFCAYSTTLAVNIMTAYIDAFMQLEQSWRERIGPVKKASAIENIIPLLIGEPMVTVASTMQATGKSFSSTNDALKRLTNVGILKIEQLQGERNRVFIADDVVYVIDDVEKTLMKQRPIARDSVYRTPDGSLAAQEGAKQVTA